MYYCASSPAYHPSELARYDDRAHDDYFHLEVWYIRRTHPRLLWNDFCQCHRPCHLDELPCVPCDDRFRHCSGVDTMCFAGVIHMTTISMLCSSHLSRSIMRMEATKRFFWSTCWFHWCNTMLLSTQHTAWEKGATSRTVASIK